MRTFQHLVSVPEGISDNADDPSQYDPGYSIGSKTLTLTFIPLAGSQLPVCTNLETVSSDLITNLELM